MIPILYKPTEKNFTTNGLGRLIDCVSCTVTEERNGIFECEFVYPITGDLYDQITEGCIVYTTHDNTKEPQPFDIYKRSAPIDGLVTFYASHISYRLNSILLKPFSAVSCAQALSFFATQTVNECPFTFWTDKDVSGPFVVDVPSNVREKLSGEQGSILDVYGTGEYKFDKWDVKLYLNRGSDTDVSIRYGKNLVDITNEIDASGLHNAVAPFWKDESGNIVMLPEYYICDSNAPVIFDVWENEVLEDISEENGTDIDFGVAIPKIETLDLSDEFEEQPTVEQLREKAMARLAASNSWVPKQNIEIDFVQLWNTQEYGNLANLERLNLCDTALVVYDALGVNVRQKVIKTVYNSLLDVYDSMELGSARQTFTEAIEDMLTGYMSEGYAKKSAVTSAVERATDIITGGAGGNVVIGMDDGVPGEILIMDTDSIETAVNVLRINKNGIGFSHNGYNGPFDTAWTLDGHFVADYITSGTLDATLLKAGTITDDKGYNYWDLETGEFRLSANTTIGSGSSAQTIGSVSTTASNAASAAAAAQQTADGAATAASNAQTTADGAVTAITTLDNSLNQQGVFNRLTNNGAAQGIYLSNGELYVNASYIKTGILSANLVRAGILSSDDGLSYWNLDTGEFVTTTNERSVKMTGGYIKVYDNSETLRGAVGTYYVTHNGSNTGARALGVHGTNTAIGLVDDANNYSFYIYINGDTTGTTSPGGYAQRLLFFGSERHNGAITNEGGVIFNGGASFVYGHAIVLKNQDGSGESARIAHISNSSDFGLALTDAKRFNIYYGTDRVICFNNGYYIANKDIIINKTVQFLDAVYFGSNPAIGPYITANNTIQLDINATYVKITAGASSTSYAFMVSCGGEFSGNVKGLSFVNTSDERLKDFLPWDDAYNTLIDDLTPQLFTWKDSEDKQKHLGFSAQKLKKALADRGINDSGLVQEDEEGYLSLNYTGLTLLLFNRVKQQDSEIKELKDRINALERMVETLCKFTNCPL